ncbi:hypothetical protein V1277_002605 [Bradyrhizobium sp. AZCC 1588]|uniref:hypothetical protein n=1 Tax=Bradyrhizobium sp. AZCC 1614 TaxID=3117017 RepID=UPI002FF0BC51
MQNTAGDSVAQAPHVVSDLINLVEHVQNSLRPIEQMIAWEVSPGAPESSINVIVLDDASPRYTKSAAAMHACNVNLGIALRSLLDSGNDDPYAASLPALSLVVA